jgi:O-antigen/teichoic acid export membrane protein
MAPFQELAGSTVYRILTLASQFLLTMLLTRIGGTEGYGLYALIVVNASLLHLFTSLGIPSGITHHTAAGLMGWGRVHRIILGSTLLQGIVLVVVEALSLTLTGHGWSWPSGAIMAVGAGMAFFFSISLTEKYTAWFLGRHQQGRSNRIIFLFTLAPLVVLAVLFLWGSRPSTGTTIGILIAFSVAQALWLALASPRLADATYPSGEDQRVQWMDFLRYSAVNYLANALQFLAYRIDYWIVDHFKGQAELGVYALAVRVGQMLWIVPIVAASILFPLGSAGKADTVLLGRLLRVMMPITLLGAVILALLSPWVIPAFFSEDFRPSVRPLLFLLPGILAFTANILLAAWFAGTGRPRYNMIISAVSCGMILLLDLLWIPRFGAVGAAWASTVAYTSSALLALWLYLRKDKPRTFRILPQPEDFRLFLSIFGRHDKP